MTEEQQTMKYINGLRYTIQEHVALHEVFSVDEAHNEDREAIKQSSTFQVSIVNQKAHRRQRSSTELHDGWLTIIQPTIKASTLTPPPTP